MIAGLGNQMPLSVPPQPRVLSRFDVRIGLMESSREFYGTMTCSGEPPQCLHSPPSARAIQELVHAWETGEEVALRVRQGICQQVG